MIDGKSSGKKNIGAFTSLYPTPIVVCGTYDSEGKANLSTLAWAGVCCSVPPALQVSLRKSRHTYNAILERKSFTVNIPSSNRADQADFCGMVSGSKIDKFAAAKLTPKRGEFVDAPIVVEFPVCMECRLLHVLEIGSHDMFVGEIVASWVNEGCLEQDGSVNPSKVSPIAFAPGDGGYYTLGHSIGRSFDIGKTFTEGKE